MESREAPHQSRLAIVGFTNHQQILHPMGGRISQKRFEPSQDILGPRVPNPARLTEKEYSLLIGKIEGGTGTGQDTIFVVHRHSSSISSKGKIFPDPRPELG